MTPGEHHKPNGDGMRRPFQFSLKALMIAVFFWCAVLSVASHLGVPFIVTLALAVVSFLLFAAALVVFLTLAQRSMFAFWDRLGAGKREPDEDWHEPKRPELPEFLQRRDEND